MSVQIKRESLTVQEAPVGGEPTGRTGPRDASGLVLNTKTRTCHTDVTVYSMLKSVKGGLIEERQSKSKKPTQSLGVSLSEHLNNQ